MKTKSISFSLVVAFIIMVFNCNTDDDALKIPIPPEPSYEDLFPDVTRLYTGSLEHNPVQLNLEYITNLYHLSTPTGQSSGIFNFEYSPNRSYIRFQGELLHRELFSIESEGNLIKIEPNTLFIKQ